MLSKSEPPGLFDAPAHDAGKIDRVCDDDRAERGLFATEQPEVAPCRAQDDEAGERQAEERVEDRKGDHEPWHSDEAYLCSPHVNEPLQNAGPPSTGTLEEALWGDSAASPMP